MTGKKVRLVRSIGDCRPYSSNKLIGTYDEYIVTTPLNGTGAGSEMIEKREVIFPCTGGQGRARGFYRQLAWYIENTMGQDAGWVYEWEMEEVESSIESLGKLMQRLKAEIEEAQSKIDFLNESGNKQLDLEEYKVYSTLKIFQNEKLTDVEKSKLIAKLIKGK